MTRAVPQPDDYDDDEDTAFLGVAYRDDGDVPKLVIVGIVWAAAGIVALIAAVLARNLALAVFGGLSTVAGGGLWIALRARDGLQDGEFTAFTDPTAGYDDDVDDDPDDGHPTRVMSAGDDDRTDGGDPDDIEDAEYTEYTDYIERVPSEQDDGTGYDDDRVAQERWEQSQRDREAAAAAEERSGRADDGPNDDGSDDDTEAVPTGADSGGSADEPSDATPGGTTDERDGSRG